MLSTLQIRNLVIVEQLELEFGSGLNVVTGETGAGKSVVLKAIQLLLGAKGGVELIRAEADRAEISGLFVISAANREIFERSASELVELIDGEELLIRRTIERGGGRSRFFVNGHLVTRGIVESVAAFLVEVTGQHDQQQLFSVTSQRQMVDQCGVSSNTLDAVKVCFEEYRELYQLLERVKNDAASKADYLRRIRFERDELAVAQLVADERERLQTELQRQSHSETLLSEIHTILEALESEHESVHTRIGLFRSKLESCIRLEPEMRELIEPLDAASAQLFEFGAGLSRVQRRIEVDPGRLERLRERVAELARLERKYGRPINQLIEYLAKIESELAMYDSGVFDEETLGAAVVEKRSQLSILEKQLTKERKAAATQLAQHVQKGLAEVQMKHAKFSIEVSDTESAVSGADRVEFFLAANPGEPAQPLSKVASGGEMSRVFLVLKTFESGQQPLLQVFDEVDVGVGGAVAHAVGEKLRRVSALGQVLLVTHSPQVAALADKHILIRKSVRAGSTVVESIGLSSDARVVEIARMLAGRRVSGNFEQSARELLSERGD